MSLVNSIYFPGDVLIKYLPLEDITRCITVHEILESNNEKFEGLIDDINILLKNPKTIKNSMNWCIYNSLDYWDGFSSIKNRRIRELSFYDKINNIEGLVLPEYLETLNISHNKIKIRGLKLPNGLKELLLHTNKIDDDCIKDLVLPPALEKLDLCVNNISGKSMKYLKLPSTLKSLCISHNNIGEGIIDLILPYGLDELDISEINLNNKILKTLKIPPNVKNLFLYNNDIDELGVKELILPLKIRTLCIFNKNLINQEELVKRLIRFAKSPEGIKRYISTQRYYDSIRSKPIWKEICRGLIYGVTEDPIFRFLKKIHGAKNIRENILTFYNPFWNLKI